MLSNGSVDSTILLATTVGIEEEMRSERQLLNDLYIHPNPFNGASTVVCNADGGSLLVEIYDITGKLVKTIHNGKSSNSVNFIPFDLSEEKSGIYLVRSTNGLNSTIQRAVLIK